MEQQGFCQGQGLEQVLWASGEGVLPAASCWRGWGDTVLPRATLQP